ncbi:MAG: 2-nitropropane dioxygenase [Polaromonas sp.]|nr:2-nitropropane dioxygenase [Polaromonas sp.]
MTLGAATTPDEAIAMDQAGVDMVVATGFEAGGHRVSFLRPAENSLIGTLALIPQVVDAIKAPVIAAGGIADGRGIAAALALGAQGVQIGTAFLACAESSASDIHRQKLFSPEARYTALTRAFSGRLARGIENRFMSELKAHDDHIASYPVQNWLMGRMKPAAIAQGRTDLMSLWSGQATPLIRHRDARSLMQALQQQTDDALRRAFHHPG